MTVYLLYAIHLRCYAYGARVSHRSHSRRGGGNEDKNTIGLVLHVCGELVPIFRLTPDSSVGLGAGIGLRYYF